LFIWKIAQKVFPKVIHMYWGDLVLGKIGSAASIHLMIVPCFNCQSQETHTYTTVAIHAWTCESSIINLFVNKMLLLIVNIKLYTVKPV